MLPLLVETSELLSGAALTAALLALLLHVVLR